MDIIDFFTMKNAFRLLIMVFVFGYVLFSLVLMLRIQILSDTLLTKRSPLVNYLAKIHFFMVLVGSIVISLLILL